MGEIMNMTKANAPLVGNKNGWSISPPERMKYEQLFKSLEPVGGYLPGNKVKGVLMDSKLPLETLGKIWDLADRDKDGRLSKDEFIIAMHLVYKALENNTVPSALPAELLDSISNAPKAPVTQISNIPSLAPVSEPSIEWIVSIEDQKAADKLFVQADKDRDGFVSGTEIKDVFLQSGLSQVVLAHIWGLCDIYQVGKLNKEQFALSMYLIKQKLNGCDLPNTLTSNMIPPLLRKDDGTATAGTPVTAITESTPQNTANYASPEMNMMIQEVDMIIHEKRLIEQDISQKEADVKIKSGEIKSLQSELDTLCATLRQLDNQKGEAQKRLNDLKTQIDKLRQQATDQEANLVGQEEELAKKRQEIESLKITEQNLETQQNEYKKQLSDLSEKLQDTQLQISQAKASMTELEEQQRQIIDVVAQFDGAFSAGDASAVPESFLSLRINLDNSMYDPVAKKKSDTKDALCKLNINENGNHQMNQENINPKKDDDGSFAADFSSGFDPAFPTDPFQNQNEKFNDPFNDYKAEHLGFDQPPQVKDPFGEDPFAALHAPTKDNPSPALPPKKKPPPPRPAPPKSSRTSPNPLQSGSPAPSDPFATNTGGSDFNFADFSKFDQ